jgi:hypothetical protein
VIAAHRRLDQTGAVSVAAALERQQNMARVRTERSIGVWRLTLTQTPADGLTHELA